MKNPISLAAIGAALLLAPLPALSHAALDQSEAAAGAPFKAVIRIGHGCAGKPTKVLRVKIPDGFYNAKPMPKPGWTLKTVSGDYARPFDNHGTPMTKGTREIVWSGGELPDEWYDEFVFVGTVGPELVPGSAIYFPTVQECGTAKEAWIDVTGAEGVEKPAPSLSITAPAKQAHDIHAGHAAASMPVAGGKVTAGDLTIADAYARATLPGAPVGGAYLSVSNAGAKDDRLVAVETPQAERVEIHEMAMEGEVMRMRKLPDGLAIPAGASVAFQPGGYHLMLMGLKEPLVEGGTLPLTLTFEHAGKVQMVLDIQAMNAKGHEHVSQ